MTKKSINIYGNRHPKRGALVANPISPENIFLYDIFKPIVDAINKLYTGASNVFKSSETIWLGVDNTINVNKEIFNKIGEYSLFGGQNIPCATINGQQIIGNDGNIIIEGIVYEAGNNIQINNGVISATDTTYNIATTESNGLMSSADKSLLISNDKKLSNVILKVIKNVPPEQNQIKYKTSDNEIINPNYATGSPSEDLPPIDKNTYYDGLGLLEFKDAVNFIGNSSFRGLTTMWYVEIPETVMRLKERCFEGTKLEEITIPKNVSIIDDRVFAMCEHLSIVKYNGTKDQFNNIRVGDDVFTNTLVTKIICIDGVITL